MKEKNSKSKIKGDAAAPSAPSKSTYANDNHPWLTTLIILHMYNSSRNRF